MYFCFKCYSFVKTVTGISLITLLFIFVLLSTLTYVPQEKPKSEVFEERLFQNVSEQEKGDEIVYGENSTKNVTLEWIKSQIDQISKAETVYNQKDFPVLKDDDLVVVVQVMASYH